MDFGSRAIRVLIARRENDGAVRILGHGAAPALGCISQGVIQDRNAAQVALGKALAAAEREARVRVPTLFCGINGKNVETFIRDGQVEIDRGQVEPAHMAEARAIASHDVLAPGRCVTWSVSGQEWYVDDLRVLDPNGIRGQVLKTRVHFARLPSAIEENILACIESQNRELEDMVFMPLAAALGCLTPEDMELGVGVLDMGRSTTGLAVYRDFRILGTISLEWGGYHITRDVAAGLHISFEEADELVLEYGLSEELIRGGIAEEGAEPMLARAPAKSENDRPGRIKLKTAVPGAPSVVDRETLDTIVYERGRELLTRVRQHLQSRGLSKNLVRGMVLTGGACTIRNYVALAETIFKVPCRVGMPNSVEIGPQPVQAPDYTAAVGIVRHAFEFRNAVQTGRVEGRGVMRTRWQRILRFFKKYFF